MSKRLRGRPRLDEHDPPVKVSVALTAKQYGALYATARVERVSISEMIRVSLTRAVRKDWPERK